MLDRPETLSLLRKAHDEIIMLRRERDALAQKAHAYDTMAIVARLSAPAEQQGYGEDVAWRLKQVVEQIEAERKAEKAG